MVLYLINSVVEFVQHQNSMEWQVSTYYVSNVRVISEQRSDLSFLSVAPNRLLFSRVNSISRIGLVEFFTQVTVKEKSFKGLLSQN